MAVKMEKNAGVDRVKQRLQEQQRTKNTHLVKEQEGMETV